MNKNTIIKLKTSFDAIQQTMPDSDVEFWYARDIMTELSKNIYERGVDDRGFGRIRSKSDKALFGEHTTKGMKNKLGIPANRPLADFLPTVTNAAKNLATEITNHNVKENDLHGDPSITGEHIRNNTSVRTILGERGIKPEGASRRRRPQKTKPPNKISRKENDQR